MGMPVASLDERALLDLMFAELDAGRGGWLITANLDFMRRWASDPAQRELYAAADLRVADGMPLLWAARLQGDPLPERVTGSGLVWTLCARAAVEGRRVLLLGGDEGAAEAARDVLTARSPALEVVGTASPWVHNPPTPEEIESIAGLLESTRPDIVLVGLGSPKQEVLISGLREHFPGMWFVGVGISFSFVAGMVERAPAWAQQAGLEWAHRLAQEPRRLARRYLLEDIPFSARFFGSALLVRARRLARRQKQARRTDR